MSVGEPPIQLLLDRKTIAFAVALIVVFSTSLLQGQNIEALPSPNGFVPDCNTPECQLARQQATNRQNQIRPSQQQTYQNPAFVQQQSPVFTGMNYPQTYGIQNPGPVVGNSIGLGSQLGPNAPQVGPLETSANGRQSQSEYYDGGNQSQNGNLNGLQNQQVMPQINMDYLSRQPSNQNAGCPTCAAQPQFQTCTVYVPYWETNYQTTWETRFRQEPRFQSYTAYRNLTHQVPVAIDYQVMVPRQKTIQYTVYKTFKEKEPEVQNFQVYVPVQKFQNVTTYETVALEQPEIDNYTVMVPKNRTKVIQYYKTEPTIRTIVKQYTRYVEVESKTKVPAYRKVAVPRSITREYTTLEPQNRTRTETYTVREPVTRDSTQTVTRVIPYTEQVNKTVTEHVPYVEQEERSYQVIIPTAKEETRKYYVTVPRYRNVEQKYTELTPKIETRQAYRTVYKQVPQTYYRVFNKDCGYWKTITETINDCQCSTGICSGETMCCPVARTVCRRVWCPNVVTERVPFTVHHTIAQQVPYTFQVTQMVPEQKTRVFPIVQFEQEERTVIEAVYAYNTETRTELLNVAKVKAETRTVQVPVQRYREVTETQAIPVTEFKTVTKTRQIQYQEMVKVKKTVTIQLPPDYRTEEYFVEQTVRVKVPRVEQREFRVTEYVNVPAERTETYTVLEPEQRSRIVPKTVYKRLPKTTQVGYTVMVPETRTRVVYKTSMKRVPEVQEKTYTVMVPERRSRIEYQTITKRVPEQRLKQYMVKIPYQVPNHTPVRTCKLVPKQIQVPTSQCTCNKQPNSRQGVSPMGQYFGTNDTGTNDTRESAPAQVVLTPELKQVRDAYGKLIGETILSGYKKLAHND